jgi:hypothetical protein
MMYHIVQLTNCFQTFQLVIAGLNRWVLDTETRHTKEAELAKYMFGTKGTHFNWCLKVSH